MHLFAESRLGNHENRVNITLHQSLTRSFLTAYTKGSEGKE